MKKRQSLLKNAMLTGLLTVSLAGFTAQVFAKPAGGNPVQECQEHGALYFAKYDWENGGYVKDPDGGVVDINGNATSGTWSSNTAIDIMIVKGSTLRDPTTYDPAADDGSFDNSGIENKDISHITFCVYEPPKPGVCCLDYDVKVSYEKFPHYFNEDGTHIHSINEPWEPVVVNRFLSCYEGSLPDGSSVTEKNCHAMFGEQDVHIWYPLPLGQNATVTSAHWFWDATSLGQLKELGIVPKGVRLLATGVELTATKNGSGVDLTLTTSAEQDTAALDILSGDKLNNGGTAISTVCSFPSGGSPYTCTDAVVGDNYRVLETEYDGSLIVYDEVKPKKK